MNIQHALIERRSQHKDRWGLAWYLAAEVCHRFYGSHGIVPHVIEHEGLEYYGIELDYVPCNVNGDRPTIGRFTMQGDVEPWAIDPNSVGSHTYPLAERMRSGANPEDLVREAIAAFRLPPYPDKSHLHCRHKRWGQSYVLVFELAARLALLHGFDEVEIWNHPFHTDHVAREHDPKHGQKEHLGHFLFRHDDREVLIAGDGRVILPEGEAPVWERYMAGDNADSLLAWLQIVLGCTGQKL